MNGYKIYCALYDEEKARKKEGLPPKWTHAEFREELVYDLLFPKEMKKHVDVLRGIIDNNTRSSGSIRTSRSFSLFGRVSRVTSAEEDERKFTSYSKINSFLKENKVNKTDYITKD